MLKDKNISKLEFCNKCNTCMTYAEYTEKYEKVMICFDEIETGLCVDYKDDILIGSLLEQIDYLIKEYPNKRLWLKLIQDK